MKIKKGAIILITFLLLPSIIAIEITYSKDTYQPQELFQAQITGNFLSLTENNLFIYRGEKAHPEPLIKGLTKQNNIYYFYAILPNEPGNLSFRIRDAEYLERGIIKSDTIIKDLFVILEDESDLYINPGFVIPKKDFSLNVKSLFGNTDMTATFEATGEEKFLSLTEQVDETINFKLPILAPQQSKITINNYEIPVFLIKKFNNTILDLEFIPHVIEGTITPNNDYHFSVLLKNPTTRNLENIIFSSDLNTVFNPTTIEILEPNQSAFVNITITVEQVEDKLNGQITAGIEEDNFFLPVEFIITNNEDDIKIEDSTTTTSGSSNLSCSQLGTICLSNQVCSGDTVSSIEGPCCIGICEEETSSTSTTWIGIILIIILIILVAYIVWKARRKKNLKSSEDILKEKEDKYKRRIEGKEVKDKLDNV